MATSTVLTAGFLLTLVLYTLADYDGKQYKCKDLKARRLEKVKKFQLYTESKMNWRQGYDQCRSLQMEMATIDNEQEYNTVLGLIRQTNKTESSFWTSGNDLAKTNRWVWETTQKEFTYFKWGAGEPNHLKFQEIEHCVELKSRINFLMNDSQCVVDSNYVICQYYEYVIVDE